jgi:hypothetical protein
LGSNCASILLLLLYSLTFLSNLHISCGLSHIIIAIYYYYC